MDTQTNRLAGLDHALRNNNEICSSGGALNTFPSILKQKYLTRGVGLVVCTQGSYKFTLNNQTFNAHAGETLFLHDESVIQIQEENGPLEIYLLIYQIDSIKTLLGNLALSMYPYILASNPTRVWSTGEENKIIRYMNQIDDTMRISDDLFCQYERKLLLLSLTYHLCSIYNRKILLQGDTVSHKNEIFVRLLQLIEQEYMNQRGVEFYADKLCLTPKYLSSLCKTICGYTVQELVFKAIIRKSISLLKNTQKSVQEISEELHFPNPSYFGTFFKKQTGLSPLQFRNNISL
ncbi:AraC family transcriptional regulator [uncultured Bacteroides sp.]|uniref:helix-turn-helix domain-containing protein n=1 Tax=uncultured Bacteroides sp. TaxID=162156 RepID=UPI002619AE9D|nr:helix-turn-helix transcriptional regulator [uncultured Bacteroides sp.]